MNKTQNYIHAHNRYQGYRDAAFHMTWEYANPLYKECDLRLLPIDDQALGFWLALNQMGDLDETGFPWDKIHSLFQSRPRRFDLAVWDGLNLCGMAMGEASKGKKFVTLKWMERFPTPHNLPRGGLSRIVFMAMSEYGKILGAQSLRVKDPLPGTESLYLEHQFSLAGRVAGAQYLTREIE